MTKELKFLLETVKGASKLITDEFEVKAKDDKGDLVTNFDLEIEQYIINKIKEEYPDFAIISEEFNSKQGLTDNCFTIDPIDGTINFAHGLPLWGIQTACIKNGKTCAAVIYLPKINELYYADKNGTFLNDKKVCVNNKSIDRGLYTIEGRNCMIARYKMDKINRHSRDLHSAAADFAFVASGKTSATNYMGDSYWDYVPGQYLVEMAGGVIYNSKGMHIAANSEEFLKVMLENTQIKDDEKLEIIKENKRKNK